MNESDNSVPAALGDDVSIGNLTVRYGDTTALRGAHLRIPAGTTTALVGESGSGKSTLALAASRLLPADAQIVSGSVRVGDTDLAALSGPRLREARGGVAAYLAQDASVALNPVLRVGSQIAEVHQVRHGVSRREAARLAENNLADVGIPDPARVARRYPHQLSGGMRQRAVIAIALAFRPRLLIADEPTTALDVTVQADILALIVRLQKQCGLTVLWITHDMSVVAEIADRVAVMYGGRIVEQADALELFESPAHPYTQALLGCFRQGRTAQPKHIVTAIKGSPPVGGVPDGCPFHPRCPHADDSHCRTTLPEPRVLGGGRQAACHHLEFAP
ncbi:ABC transporter ATP-binding protein [Streptomyces sp. NPDC093223]|uniref:ABC transporter ATP-binding protein n=1 Tax=Streptomyces sp. NPDC093223 TaxID=3366033 RepID=UPI0037F6B82F